MDVPSPAQRNLRPAPRPARGSRVAAACLGCLALFGVPAGAGVPAQRVLARSAPGEGQRPEEARKRRTALRFEVTLAEGLTQGPQSGRLLVMVNPEAEPEPRFWVGEAGLNAPLVLGRDVQDLSPGGVAVVDGSAATFPIPNLADIPLGEYNVQAALATNPDLRGVNAPGNLYSAVQRSQVDPARGGVVKIRLSEAVPPDELPPDSEFVKYLRIQSELLTKFHGRPIFLRAGVILPRAYSREPARRFPLRVQIGGFAARCTHVRTMMREGNSFRRAWQAEDAPQMIVLHLDGAGPYGDPYQVNSANNGPYGDAIIRELIPFVERQFRAVGQPYARVLSGGSTGGWVSLALQVFYPGFFNGAWSFCPDGVDFRALQVINIYADRNAYWFWQWFERPSARDADGAIRYTMRHECQMENVMGLGDSWTMSGGQWGAWNAAFGPRSADGRPVPLWHPQTGEIDRAAAAHWKQYDLRFILEENWKTLGPKLRGKLRIWVGEADNYFLNHAVHLLDEFLGRADPPYEGQIRFGPGEGHCWMGIGERQLMDEMAAAIEAAKPRSR